MILKILRDLVVQIYPISAIFHFWMLQYRILLYSVLKYILRYRRSISYPISKHNIRASISKIHDAAIVIYQYRVLYWKSRIGKVPDDFMKCRDIAEPGTHNDISFWMQLFDLPGCWPVGWDWLLPVVTPIQVQAHEFNQHQP